MHHKNKINMLKIVNNILIMFFAALVLFGCKSVNVQTTLILQEDLRSNTEGLIILKDDILNTIVSQKKVNMPIVRFYRSDNNSFKEFDFNEINYRDAIFLNKSNEANCKNYDIQKWFECSMRNYPKEKNFTDIYIYSTAKKKQIDQVKSIETNYKVYYYIDDLKNDIVENITSNKKTPHNILILYHFDNAPPKQRCDTLDLWINTNKIDLQPEIINLNPRYRENPTFYRPCVGNRAYLIQWTSIPGINNYELHLNNITFDVFVDNSMKEYHDIAFIRNNIVNYYLCEKTFGELCARVIDGNFDSDCAECEYICIYTNRWDVKVRVNECESILGPFSKVINTMSFQCSLKTTE
jgi:hypothetical protein